MKPLVKWVGGKRRFLNQIEKELKEFSKIRNYYEPFFGSGALFFHLENKNSTINDLNRNLMNFYEWVKKDYNNLYKQILKLSKNSLKKEVYYKMRETYNNTINEMTLNNAALFFVINKTCFNGIYRVNLNGLFNVPMGKYERIHIPSLEEFEETSKLLENTKIFSGDWRKSIEKAGKNDLIYIDPPYFPDESSKFVGYTDPKFGKIEHEIMLRILKAKIDKGTVVIMSNSYSFELEKLIKEIIGKSYKRINIPTKRSINPLAENKERFIETLYIMGGKNE